MATFNYLICKSETRKIKAKDGDTTVTTEETIFVPVHTPLPSLAMAKTVIPFIQPNHDTNLSVLVQEKI